MTAALDKVAEKVPLQCPPVQAKKTQRFNLVQVTANAPACKRLDSHEFHNEAFDKNYPNLQSTMLIFSEKIILKLDCLENELIDQQFHLQPCLNCAGDGSKYTVLGSIPHDDLDIAASQHGLQKLLLSAFHIDRKVCLVTSLLSFQN